MTNPARSPITSCHETDNAQLRPATLADLDALIALENATFNSDRLSARQWRRHLLSAHACILVASQRGALVAAAVLFFRSNSRIARLYSIAVSLKARGQGLGERLLDGCEDAARARHCQALRLEVRKDNPSARRLYERRGYRLFGERLGYYDDGEDALRYQKSLQHA